MPLDLAAFLISILALLVSLVALVRDHYRVKTRASIYEAEKGQWAISLVAANAGRRPITISFLTAQAPGRNPISRSFTGSGPARIDVNDSAVTCVEANDPLYVWSSLDELRATTFRFEDVHGRSYRVQ